MTGTPVERGVARQVEPVGVVVEVADRDPLGADVPRGKRVIRVATDIGAPVTLDRDLQPADRLADVADPIRLSLTASWSHAFYDHAHDDGTPLRDVRIESGTTRGPALPLRNERC